MDITRWSTQKSELLFAARDGEALYSQQKQDWKQNVAQNMIAKFRFKSKKVGKTTRPFRYDLSQIPYNYTVEVTNRLDLINRVPEEQWMEVHDTIQEAGIKTIPKKNCRKARWLPEEALQIAEKRREAKGKGERKDILI